MYSGVGLGGDCRDRPGLCRLGFDLNMREVKIMRVRMVCVRLPKFMGNVVRMLAGKRRG